MFDIDVVNDTMQLNTVEVWNIVNNSNMAHPMHIHGVSFTVLERNGAPPPAWEQGPKDVVLVDRLGTVKLVMRFGEVTDGWPFMYHCHNLLHEDNMMMLQYIVQDPSLGVSEPTSGGANAFPNPTSGQVVVRSEFALASLEVNDALGRLVVKQNGNGAQQAKIDLRGLPAGLYRVTLMGAAQRSQLIVVKE